jgi:hypothetical protein
MRNETLYHKTNLKPDEMVWVDVNYKDGSTGRKRARIVGFTPERVKCIVRGGKNGSYITKKDNPDELRVFHFKLERINKSVDNVLSQIGFKKL